MTREMTAVEARDIGAGRGVPVPKGLPPLSEPRPFPYLSNRVDGMEHQQLTSIRAGLEE